MRDEFQPGDVVRVIPPDYERQEDLLENIGFNEDMENDIGKTFTVVSCFPFDGEYTCYSLENSEWKWAHEWLELVEAASSTATTFTDEDFDPIFN